MADDFAAKIEHHESSDEIEEISLEGSSKEEIASDYDEDQVEVIIVTPESVAEYKRNKRLTKGVKVPKERKKFVGKVEKFTKKYLINGYYKCDKCDYSVEAKEEHPDRLVRFKPRDLFKRHYERHNEKTLPCSECGKLFASTNLLQNHMRFHAKRYSCDQCDFRSVNIVRLNDHKLTVHSKEEPQIECELCDKLFLTKLQLYRHKVAHHQSKTFECEICGLKMATKGMLTSHMKCKHEVNEVECPTCSKIFKNKTCLASHMQIHQEQTPAEWECPTCNAVITSKSKRKLGQSIKRHLQVHEAPMYKCDFCDKTFRNKTSYNGHINEHKGLTPYKCEQCNKSYPSQAGLTQHFHRSAAHRQ